MVFLLCAAFGVKAQSRRSYIPNDIVSLLSLLQKDTLREFNYVTLPRRTNIISERDTLDGDLVVFFDYEGQAFREHKIKFKSGCFENLYVNSFIPLGGLWIKDCFVKELSLTPHYIFINPSRDSLFLREKKEFLISESILESVLCNPFYDTYEEINLDQEIVPKFSFLGDTIRQMEILCSLQRSDYFFGNCVINHLIVRGKLSNIGLNIIPFYSERNGILLRNKILVSDLDLSSCEIDKLLDLNKLIRKREKACTIRYKIDYKDKIIFDYRYFQLDTAYFVLDEFDKRSSDNLLTAFIKLIEMQKEQGFEEGEKKAIIEYNNLKLAYKFNLQLWFSKHWWNYGYDQGRVLNWTLCFFLFFFFTNLLLLNKVFRKVYAIKTLESYFADSHKDDNRVQRWWYYFGGTFLYSLLIFFGIKIEVANFNIKQTRLHYLAAIYLYFFYILGLVCLAFIAKYFFLG